MKEFNLDAALNGEPKISIEDLPKPFKPEENEVYYVISPNHEEPQRYKARCLDHCSIQNGLIL